MPRFRWPKFRIAHNRRYRGGLTAHHKVALMWNPNALRRAGNGCAQTGKMVHMRTLVYHLP